MITATMYEKFSALSTIRNHQVISGTIKSLGGNDDGMTPHELLESALASCTIITLQMYAVRKGWDVQAIDVTVTTDSEGENSHLTREITLRGDLDEEQKKRLIEIANKCPIHKLLKSNIEIETLVKN